MLYLTQQEPPKKLVRSDYIVPVVHTNVMLDSLRENTLNMV